jgi:hypothetical protein
MITADARLCHPWLRINRVLRVMLGHALQRGGVAVAKDGTSPYEAGPTRRWLHVKQEGCTVAEDGWRRISVALSAR